MKKTARLHLVLVSFTAIPVMVACGHSAADPAGSASDLSANAPATSASSTASAAASSTTPSTKTTAAPTTTTAPSSTTPTTTTPPSADACETKFNQCLAATPSAATVIACENACACDPNADDCACADACDAKCDDACGAAVDTCSKTVFSDPVCADVGGGGGPAGDDPCDALFNKCAAANPKAAAVMACEDACQCDPNQDDCACMDTCDKACDQDCQAAFDSCDQHVLADGQCAAN